MMKEADGKQVAPQYSIEDFVQSLETPRKILLIVKAGTPTDATIQTLLQHHDERDVLIVGGNTFFKDTQRRSDELRSYGIHIIGTGVARGREGALARPSLRPG